MACLCPAAFSSAELLPKDTSVNDANNQVVLKLLDQPVILTSGPCVAESCLRSPSGCFAGSVSGYSVTVSPDDSFALASASRAALLFCLGALIGCLFTLPHAWHFRTSTSAHDFRPPLLGFSTRVVQDCPSTKMASQYLQSICFIVGLSRILVFKETERKSVTMCRAKPLKARSFLLLAKLSSGFRSGCISWVTVRYVAACWRNEILEYMGRF